VSDIAFGSSITLRNNGNGGVLLHSHVQEYPSGSKQQQVTAYSHLDSNNYWTILPKDLDAVGGLVKGTTACAGDGPHRLRCAPKARERCAERADYHGARQHDRRAGAQRHPSAAAQPRHCW